MKKIFLVLILLVLTGAACGGASGTALQEGVTADRIIVEKSARRLTLMRAGEPLKTYRVALGRKPMGKKELEGDKKTPEGIYMIDSRNDHSSFYRALHVSYPNPNDVLQAKKFGVSPGGDIMIHGLPNGLGWLGSLHRHMDWTAGCIAVTNKEIDELWHAVPNGTPIEIRQ